MLLYCNHAEFSILSCPKTFVSYLGQKVTQIGAFLTLASHAYVGNRRPAEVCAVGGVIFVLNPVIASVSHSVSFAD